MTKHKDIADVAHYGCWALNIIAANFTAAEAAVNAACGRAAIEAAIARHATAKERDAGALKALK
jgi:hypothetical protein